MYIVTGAAGFIGSVVVAELNRQKPLAEVVVVDWLGEDQRWKNLSKRRVKDILFPEQLASYLDHHEEEIQGVIHLGAISSTTCTDGDALVRQNIHDTMMLFNWCAVTETPFIYASSAATYGNAETGFEDREDLAYLDTLRPLNAYGFSKNMVDKSIFATPEEERPPQCVALKFFNVYGPNEYHKGRMQSVIAQVYRQALETGKIRLFKSGRDDIPHGEQMRDFVYVKDIASAIIWLLDHPDVSGMFNLGAGKARSFNDLAAAIFAALGKSTGISYIDMPDDVKNQYQYFTEAPMEKFHGAYLRHEGTPFPVTSLEDGVRDYVQNYLLNADPYL